MNKRKRRYRFCLQSSQSPTHYNLSRYLQALGWHSSRFHWHTDFNDNYLQFNLKAAQHLEYKHLLAQLVGNYCEEVMPLTYCINDQNWPTVLNQLAINFYRQDLHLLNEIDDLVWILKPALLNNGKQIKIFQRLGELEQHFLSRNRLGGEHVLQQYLTHPHLLREKHKYSIRMFVITTNFAGVYLYPHGYFNVALQPYNDKQFSDMRPHLTNEHLHENESNVVQIPSQKFDFFKSFYPQIKTIVTATFKGLKQMHPHAFVCQKQPSLAIFGFDFMVDNKHRLWLLEANHGPCFPTADEHPLQQYLYNDFWQAFIASFIIPLVEDHAPHSIQLPVFESLEI